MNPRSPDLDDLVEETRGAQPWRRLFHIANGVLFVLLLDGLDVSRAVAVGTFACILAILIVTDFVRLKRPDLNALFFRTFRILASPREARGPASSTWYVLGVLITVALFPRYAALSGILVLALADPAASFLGRRWGQRPFLGGSLEGSLVFVGVALAVLLARHSPPVAVVAAVAVTLAERLSWPLDDNLSIPVAAAAVLTALETLP